MKKYLLGVVTTATLLCSPFVFADTTLQDPPTTTTTPSTTDSMPSTSTSTTNTTATTGTTDIQLKTLDGKIIHVHIDPLDLQGVSVGDKLEVTDLGTSATTSTGASTGTTSTDGTTTTNGTTTNGSSDVTQ